MRSGYIRIENGRLGYTGYYGGYWPSFATSSIWGNAGFGAYFLDFSKTNIYPSNGPTNQWRDFSLR